MQNKISIKWFVLFLIIISTIETGFIGYYFFTKRGVGPGFYFRKFINKPSDKVIHNYYYKDLKEEYKHLNYKDNHKPFIVFVGDSITKRFNIYEFAQNKNVLNRGIFLDTTQGLISRIDENISNLNVQKIFLMIGYNDLKYRSNSEIVTNIEKILLKLNKYEIYLQSILPVSSKRENENLRIIAVNNELQKLAKEKKCKYIDLHSSFFLDKIGIDPKLTRDGTHPNYLGYKLWFSIIKNYIDH